MHAVDGILSLLEQYGSLIFFFGVMAESAGAPLPGEAVLVAAVLALILVFFLAYRWVAGHRELLTERWQSLLSRPRVSRMRERYDRQLGWMFRRMSPGQYLGLHLTIGLLVAAGCLWLFGGLAEDYLTRDPIVSFDHTVASALHGAATPFATKVFLGITALGSIETIALVGVLVAGLLVWRRRWLYASGWLVALGGAVALNVLLKHIFERPRPVFVDPIIVGTSYSFPSGHAMDSLVMYGMLAYFALLVIGRWRVRMAILFGAALLVILIGFSRMYLGVHYFSDVVAGFAAGGVWLSACVTGLQTLRRRGKQKAGNL